MQEQTYQKINQALTWKRIIQFNALVLFGAVTLLSSSFVQNNSLKRNSKAADIVISPTKTIVSSLTIPIIYPTEPPQIDRVSLFFGKPGDTVVISGNNFGDEQGVSKVYVGNTDASTDSVVRWTNSILEVKIPSQAQTGKVWVIINDKQATWDGDLLISSGVNTAQIGFESTTPKKTRLLVYSAADLKKGVVELSYTGQSPVFVAAPGVNIDSQTTSTDQLGNKLKILFNFKDAHSEQKILLGTVENSGGGALEIIKAELYNSASSIIPLFADPLQIKSNPQ
ncbi:MAG: IPT/TIG domain-containing protein [Patescibacteria group bacterium]